MAYSDIAAITMDSDFRLRVAACVAEQQQAGETYDPIDPLVWADANRWAMAGAPGFGNAYASAVAAGVSRPGNDPAVISDGQILAQVQAVHGAGQTP
jgi:hypothetical protein